MHDVVVAGGGPAGLVVALEAARAGMDVVVCEKRSGTIDKACGEGLMPAAVRALAVLGVDPPGCDLHGIRYRQGDCLATARFTSGPGRGVRRTALHGSLRAAVAAAGVPVLERDVGGVVQHGDHVAAGGLRARYLVAADGLHSPIRASLGLSLPPRPGSVARWGQRRHFRLADDADDARDADAPAGGPLIAGDFVDVIWARTAEAYLTPVADGVLGVAVLSSVRAPFAEQLAAFPALAERLARAMPVSDVRGAGPLRQQARARVAGRVLLVGDAAGYIDALTGEGLALSIAAAGELVSCLRDGKPERYERAWRRTSRRSRLITSGLLWARGRPAIGRAVVPAAAHLRPLFAVAVNQLAG